MANPVFIYQEDCGFGFQRRQKKYIIFIYHVTSLSTFFLRKFQIDYHSFENSKRIPRYANRNLFEV
jgi:hypothetical protein